MWALHDLFVYMQPVAEALLAELKVKNEFFLERDKYALFIKLIKQREQWELVCADAFSREEPR